MSIHISMYTPMYMYIHVYVHVYTQAARRQDEEEAVRIEEAFKRKEAEVRARVRAFVRASEVRWIEESCRTKEAEL